MAGDFRLRLDSAAIDQLEQDDDVENLVLEAGEAVAELAGQLAPKSTGAGAASIHAQPSEDGDGVSVSWDADHFYMGFHELGTEELPARGFLRTAADTASL